VRLPLLLAAGTFAAAIHAAQPATSATAGATIAAPLGARSVTPGVGRCTSDGACTVTDDRGTRAAAPLRLAP
jgi:hypothetical protein